MAQLETLYVQIRTRKKKWLIFSISIVAMTIIIVPIVLEVAVTKKKTHVIETSTTTTKILTSTITTAPANITIATGILFQE
ncbi:hypothetical protein I4U23_012328 [Adineta vaga]|nr:hypothetical protein I4U23_012328 [Adineta vaga]